MNEARQQALEEAIQVCVKLSEYYVSQGLGPLAACVIARDTALRVADHIRALLMEEPCLPTLADLYAQLRILTAEIDRRETAARRAPP